MEEGNAQTWLAQYVNEPKYLEFQQTEVHLLADLASIAKR
jgi:hypothetical protein